MRRWLIGALACGAVGCAKSQVEVDPAAGLNGGFEVARDGVPVNWQRYDPDDALFSATLDPTERTEGDVSLRFDVQACGGEPGWHSPGVAQEWPVTPGTWEVSADVRRADGATWRLSTGSVDAGSGAHQAVDSADMAQDTWVTATRTVDVPPGHDRVRVELIVLSPGRVWVDNVRISPSTR